MKKLAAIVVSVAVMISLSGCITAIALKEERRKVNELPDTTYMMNESMYACSSGDSLVKDYVVKELDMGPKIHLHDFNVACFVRDAFAKRSSETPMLRNTFESVTILNVSADAQLSTFWKGPWAKIMITAEATTAAGGKKTVRGRGHCHMVSENIEIFSRHQIMRTARNAADALVSAIVEGKDDVETGNNMDCLPDGHVVNN